MTFAAICHLQKLLLAPLQSWLSSLIKKELIEFYFIRTKPIAQQRVRAQDKPTVQEQFKKYLRFIQKYSIKLKSIQNIDKTGFRIRILGGEQIIVPQTAKQLYTLSIENCLFITILKTVSVVGGNILLVLIILGKIHIDSQY